MRLRAIAGSLLVLLLCGCSFTSQLPPLPQLSTPTSSAIQIGLTKVQDLRSDNNIGTVGKANFQLGSELDEYLYRALAARLTQVGYAVHQIPERSTFPGQMKVVTVVLQSVSIKSGDALIEPVDAEARCEVKVLDLSGSQIYVQRYRGSLSERVDSESLNMMKATGNIVAKMLDQLANEIVKDPDLQKALR